MQQVFQKLDRYFPRGWRLAVLDMLKGRWIVKPAAGVIGYLKAENARGRHILIQPEDPSHYLLADDLSWELILTHHRRTDGAWKPGRMVVETSPRNFQVWIRSHKPLTLDEKRYWLKKLGSDPGADPNNRWGRCPGFRNCKDKHRDEQGRYPLSRLIWIDWARQAHVPEIPFKRCRPHAQSFSHLPPVGGVCRRNSEIYRSDYDRGNDSATDFSYALALMRRGYADDHVRSRLLAQRNQWHNHQGQRKIDAYIDRTIRRARAVIAVG